MRLEEIRKGIHAYRLALGDDVTIRGVSIDSRTAQKGDLFFAIAGETHDGHDFLPAAAEAGCPAALVERRRPIDPELAKRFPGGLIGVDDPTEALGKLAILHRQQSPASVVAVTGSNGKTTVKQMIHHILGGRMTGSCSPKSYNNKYGVPLTLLDVSLSDEYVICEIGTSGPGEIASLSLIVRPDVAVITSIGAAHLAGLGSLERIASEKASILSWAADSALGVVWADSEALTKSLRGYSCRRVRFGQSDTADLRLTDYEPRGRGQRFCLNGRLWVDLPMPGRHNALNAIAAIAVAQRFGFSQEDAAGALANYTGQSMRLQWLEAGSMTVINDAYNANPTSMLAAARTLVDHVAGRRVMVVGEMRELGDSSDALHGDTGRDIAAAGVELVIGVGGPGCRIARGAAEAGAQSACFETVEDACEGIASLLAEGDTVLIKGSRAVGMERLVAPIRGAQGVGEQPPDAV